MRWFDFIKRSPPTCAFVAVALTAFLFLLSVYVRIWTPEYGLTKFLRVGKEFDVRGIAAYRATPKYVDPYPPNRWGFDGQFYAEIALDPLLRDPAMATAVDGPVYRGRRILLPWLAWLGGVGRPFWVLNVYAALNLIFWIPYAWILGRWLRPHGWRGLFGYAAVLLTCGIIECMTKSLTDFPSVVLMLAAVLVGGAGGAGWLALASLARESSLLGFVGLAELGPPWRDALRKNLVRGLIAALPLALWVGYVLWRFSDRIDIAGDNLGLPLGGIVQKLGELSVTLQRVRWHRWWMEFFKSYELHALLTIVAFLTQSLYLLLYREWSSRLWRMAIAFVPYFLSIGFLSWDDHFTVTRHALPITIVFNLLLAARPRRGWLAWFLLGNCFVPFGVHFFFVQPIDQTPPRPAEYVMVGGSTATSAIRIDYGSDWSAQQWDRGHTWRWALEETSRISILNETTTARVAELGFTLRALDERELEIKAGGETLWRGRVSGVPQIAKISVRLLPGENSLLFVTHGQGVPMGEPVSHRVNFAVEDVRVEVAP